MNAKFNILKSYSLVVLFLLLAAYANDLNHYLVEVVSIIGAAFFFLIAWIELKNL